MPRLFGYSLPPVGSRQGYTGTTAPVGWILASGRTIGSAASGGTERANADTFALYSLLWSSYSNTLLVIQTSGGVPTTRGVDAATDFAANKRLPVPDYRGRIGVGKDDMGGSTASRITNTNSGIVGTTLGAFGGHEQPGQHQHGPGTLSTGNVSANHTHTASTFNSKNDNQTGMVGGNGASGAAWLSSIENVGHSHAVTAGQTATSGTGISGVGNGNVQPTVIEAYIIKL